MERTQPEGSKVGKPLLACSRTRRASSGPELTSKSKEPNQNPPAQRTSWKGISACGSEDRVTPVNSLQKRTATGEPQSSCGCNSCCASYVLTEARGWFKAPESGVSAKDWKAPQEDGAALEAGPPG